MPPRQVGMRAFLEATIAQKERWRPQAVGFISSVWPRLAARMNASVRGRKLHMQTKTTDY